MAAWHAWNTDRTASLCGLKFSPDTKVPRMAGERKGEAHRKVTCGECLILLGRRET